MHDHFCDRCGAKINISSADWGDCLECLKDLCIKCAKSFNNEGVCEKCAERSNIRHSNIKIENTPKGWQIAGMSYYQFELLTQVIMTYPENDHHNMMEFLNDLALMLERYEPTPDIHSKIVAMFSGIEDPRFARCNIRFLDDGTTCTVTIALYGGTEDDGNDDGIFYYTEGMSDLISLCQAGMEDFIIIDVLSIE
jgi:hypothetical protein